MKSWNEIRKEAEVNMKGIFVLSVVMLCVGCEKHWAMQLADEVNKGLPAEFEDGCLDGYRMYSYDASFLCGKIKSFINGRLAECENVTLDDFRRSAPLVYFVALKYEDDCYRGIRRESSERFRLQYGAIEHRMQDGLDQDDQPRNRCFTFFMVSELDKVYALSIDVSRNPVSGHWRVGRDFLYGSVSLPVSIWDASFPDRNFPEQILTRRYKDVFAVLTERPFDYSCYENVKSLKNFRELRGRSMFRLCWSNPKCMIFIPEYLL